jgi:hypothetical protein
MLREKQKKYQEAQRYYEQSLKLREKASSPPAPRPRTCCAAVHT